MFPHAGGHGCGCFPADCAVLFDEVCGYAESAYFCLVAVCDCAFQEEAADAGHIGEAGGKFASGAGFREGKGGAGLFEEAGHDVVEWAFVFIKDGFAEALSDGVECGREVLPGFGFICALCGYAHGNDAFFGLGGDFWISVFAHEVMQAFADY